MSLYNKHDKEAQVADFFIKKYKENISIVPDIQDEESDFILRFLDREIKAQIVSCDHEAIPIIVNTQKHKGEVFDIDRDRVSSVILQIKKKSEHYTPDLLKNMFLLIHSESIRFNHEYIIDKTKKICQQSNYKSIFFVRLPDNDKKNTFPSNNGDIIQLK